MIPLTGKVAVISGASAGIGAALARQCAAAGMAVVCCARRRERLDALARDIESAGGRAHPVTADVTVPADMTRLVDEANRTFGRIDAVVCNAGIGFYGPLEQTPVDVMRRILDVNYMGTFHLAQAALPFIRQQGAGHLLIVSSIVGRRAIPAAVAYSASKFAQVGLAESLRAELVGTGVHVTLVCPVSTATEFREAARRNFGIAYEGVGPSQTADQVAAAMLRALRRPRAEVHPYPPSRALVVLATLAPGLADRVVQRFERGRRPTT